MGAGIAPEQIGPRADDGHQRGDQFFANRIERRIRHLREVLVEIIVKQLRALREHGNRLVGSHGADRIIAILRHRLQEELQIFLRVAKGLLAIEQHRGIVGCRKQRRVPAVPAVRAA